MQIQLSDHFTYRRLLRFTFPSIIMMLFTSIYGVVDGIFVSNFVGTTAFAAINLIMPYIMLFGTVGIMVGTGGTALISKTLGEGKEEKANELFSMLVYLSIAGGVVLTVFALALLRPVAVLLGAEGEMLEACVEYGIFTLPVMTAFILQNEFQCFCTAAEKPNLGLWLTVAAGVTNMALDGLFVGVWGFGLVGAAVATSLSQCVGGLMPMVYFARKNGSRLRLVKAGFDGSAVAKTCLNGLSELMSNLSLSFVSMLYNFQLMRYAGENGVAAYGVLMYVNFIFIAVFLGYSMGSAPVIGYHYGAGNREELKSLFRKSIRIVLAISVGLTALAEVLSGFLSGIFVGYDPVLYDMTRKAFMVYSLSFLLCGFNMFGSSFFTALNNGPVSAAISFLRMLVFQAAGVLLLPVFFDLEGVWWSIVVAEAGALLVTGFCFAKYRGRYHF